MSFNNTPNENMETAKKVLGIHDNHGKKLYQKRAKKVLPVLVRQAEAAKKIPYSYLAEELGIPNPRNLDYPLGSIGKTLQDLGKSWGEKIPPIQCLVVNKDTELPGEGISGFINDFINIKNEFRKLSRKDQGDLVSYLLEKISGYDKWDSVLEALELEPAPIPESAIQEAEKSASSRRGGGEESIEHKELKQYIANNPQSIGIRTRNWEIRIEKGLPSGDFMDVSFKNKHRWIGVEVKPKTADKDDIKRGLYQCVKYQAVMDAYLSSKSERKDTETILVLGGKFPESLIATRNRLGIKKIFENIKVKSK